MTPHTRIYPATNILEKLHNFMACVEHNLELEPRVID